jgi:hypothetical protein
VTAILNFESLRKVTTLLLEYFWQCWRKIVIFHTKYPTNFRVSFRNWKKYDFFCVKSWFFHTKYPKNFSASLRSGQFFLSAPRLPWNPGSAPGMDIHLSTLYLLQQV